MEEAFKMRNLLQEFLITHGVRKPTILGFREHIFTGRCLNCCYISCIFFTFDAVADKKITMYQSTNV